MNIIIDTHIFLWALADPSRLTASHRRELENPVNAVYLSSVSVTELMIKASLGQLQLGFDPIDMARQSGFELLDYSAEDAAPLRALPFHHRDPFDRMLIAQSLARGYRLMSNDTKFEHYECRLVK